MKLADVKKINLAALPTPLQFMPNLTKRLGGGNLYIKRDDMTDVALSGNKIRKLEYLVRDALDRGCNTLLTLGGPARPGRALQGQKMRCFANSRPTQGMEICCLFRTRHWPEVCLRQKIRCLSKREPPQTEARQKETSRSRETIYRTLSS